MAIRVASLEEAVKEVVSLTLDSVNEWEQVCCEREDFEEGTEERADLDEQELDAYYGQLHCRDEIAEVRKQVLTVQPQTEHIERMLQELDKAEDCITE